MDKILCKESRRFLKIDDSFRLKSNIMNECERINKNQFLVVVIGLGYVGLPLARLFSTKYRTLGFDINQKRVNELMDGQDSTFEVSNDLLKEAIEKHDFLCTSDLSKVKDVKSSVGLNTLFIVTVPTPIDNKNRPDLTPLLKASEVVGQVIKEGDIVVYESTVYPGVTEEECLPIVEYVSGLKYNIDFFAGYSPERINPGDKEHTVEKIKKVTSGSTPEIALIIDALYNSVLENGTHLAPTIRVAEASKIVENCQRDVQIAFFNELSRIFNVMGINTNDVIEAAASKWNFIKLKPGLVGGHCISVDPYYLIEKSQVQGYSPNILITARQVNDSMGGFVAEQVIKLMNKKGILVKDARILILGITFKENCPDIRNTKVVDIYKSLSEYSSKISIYDPLANLLDIKRNYGLDILNNESELNAGSYDAIILAVSHTEILKMDIYRYARENSVVYDVKGVLDRNVDGQL